jgi:primosomal protein N' (replication factor Y)
MVTKGLDFPNVTLVGVISADTALNVPDFRAAERTFQLLSQVAGRAGRGAIAGRVLIQTLAADDISITTAASHNFAQFIEQEMEHRSLIPNPPFSHVVNIISSDEDEQRAKSRLEKLAARFQDAIAKENGTEVLGPVSCPLSRVKNKFRFHLLLRDRSKPRLHRILKTFDALPREDREGLVVDVDAMTIL